MRGTGDVSSREVNTLVAYGDKGHWNCPFCRPSSGSLATLNPALIWRVPHGWAGNGHSPLPGSQRLQILSTVGDLCLSCRELTTPGRPFSTLAPLPSLTEGQRWQREVLGGKGGMDDPC